MICPFCGKEMREGFIPAGSSGLVWRSGELLESDVYLSRIPVLRGQSATAYYCPDCRQVIVPVPELEEFEDTVKRKLGAVMENFVVAKDGFMEQREEKQRQKEKEKRKGKDPWEL